MGDSQLLKSLRILITETAASGDQEDPCQIAQNQSAKDWVVDG